MRDYIRFPPSIDYWHPISIQLISYHRKDFESSKISLFKDYDIYPLVICHFKRDKSDQSFQMSPQCAASLNLSIVIHCVLLAFNPLSICDTQDLLMPYGSNAQRLSETSTTNSGFTELNNVYGSNRLTEFHNAVHSWCNTDSWAAEACWIHNDTWEHSREELGHW